MGRVTEGTTHSAGIESETLQLRRGALSLVDGTVIGVASTSLAYSLTATIALLIGSVGLFSPSAMVIAFLPMLGVAIGFYWLNSGPARERCRSVSRC